jgi:uncharacterized tellurite resistance protein B-like protein
MDRPDWLKCSPHAPLLHALRSLAWADGVLDRAEAAAIARVAMTLEVPITCASLEAWLGEVPDEEAPPESDTFGRLFVLSQALRLAWADGSFCPDERARINRWAQGWGITAAQLAAIEAELQAEREATVTDSFT